jgi:ribosome biogenesis GTPase
VTVATGLVTSTHRRHYAVALDDGRAAFCVLRGRARTITCGDRVEVDVSPNGDGVITDVLPRTTLCYRSDAHREKLIAANVTQILGIVAPDPPYDDELVHRGPSLPKAAAAASCWSRTRAIFQGLRRSSRAWRR